MESDPHPKISAVRVIWTSFAVDLSDIILSLIVAILSGSVILITQVLEGLTDLIASGLLVIGQRRASHRSDKNHPFGYGRELYFWSLLAGLVMLGITATFSFYFGWQRFLNPEPVHNLFLAIGVLILTFFTNGYALMLSWRRLLNKHHPSQIWHVFYRSSLIETKTTLILDLMGTTASLLGAIALIIYWLTGDYRFDGIGAMIIGIVLAIFAYLLLLGVRDLLIGQSASNEIEDQIRHATLAHPSVKQIVGLKTMHLGNEHLLVNLDVHLEGKLNTIQIEQLIKDLKTKITAEVPTAKHIQIELETPRR